LRIYKKGYLRKEIEPLVRKIKEEIRELNKEAELSIRARVCGSYRRRAETMGDMDILICDEADRTILKRVVDRLVNSGIITETLGLGPSKFMGIVMVNETAFRLDIEAVTVEEWPFALVYFTGSGSFNEKQRTIAKRMGYRLSEHGLKEVDTGIFVKGLTNEKEIFNFLGMEYLPPWKR
jgi:DNA polymerase/3'-5' exonuclease PolX